jgi:hypothetical protein
VNRQRRCAEVGAIWPNHRAMKEMISSTVIHGGAPGAGCCTLHRRWGRSASPWGW